MTDFRKVLLAVCPHGKPSIIEGFADAMQSCISCADISTPNRLAAFIGQCAEESAGFATTTEYASGKAYNGRKDLGNTQPGDGPRFKGRGVIQLTGRANYRQAGAALGLPLETDPARAADFPAAALVAAWFWKKRGINAYADRGLIQTVTKLVNGGENGYARRLAYTKKAAAALADLKGALLQTVKEEKAKAAIKGSIASSAALVAAPAVPQGVSPIVAAHATVGASSAAALVVGGVALVGAVAWLTLAAKKHSDAAQALTKAAKGA
ncbi:hypothetical protein K9U39_10890 [Rhodoblastus acidophilus]|uniref:Glycoside hydrolase family 19 catalytic domain-containing protein n=1 Tax=Candidatus Rhodoblastus alkanivorans TaxID=2954117 RepID=A0ABS9Z953_9HYPH|nr:glycoside hydrolase family 19 protein [Candidatus Rhodoblastus alkanivorans]MCI4680160.1 hypothetical protein [Candidatus Rhodoblastus alkanivorans]MCI4684117.1 hypothetical protein [Candidatus Rhodoblastus alkanivorans]MDI4641437.1 hypothetical protein [Rhodoblastus acidophilus]